MTQRVHQSANVVALLSLRTDHETQTVCTDATGRVWCTTTTWGPDQDGALRTWTSRCSCDSFETYWQQFVQSPGWVHYVPTFVHAEVRPVVRQWLGGDEAALRLGAHWQPVLREWPNAVTDNPPVGAVDRLAQ